MRKTEITVQVFEDLDVILSKLNHLGYTIIERCQINDWYFTALSTAKEVAYDQLLAHSFLLRERVAADQSKRIFLCYKDKEIDANGNVVSEEKIQAPVSDLTNTLRIFWKAKLNCWGIVNNSIYTFRRGNIEFSVHAIAELGNFIEYEESPVMHDMTSQQKIDLMWSQLKNLNLELGTDWSCKKIYMLYQKYRHSQ